VTESIDYFSKDHPLREWATRRGLKARHAMYAVFETVVPCDSDTTVIDIGVTPDRSLADSNFFETLYPYPHRITATSIEDASHLESVYPGLSFVQTDGHTLPFPDGAFDVAFSSAVLEHVGETQHQKRFISELRRVSRSFFLTTPNRWFPVEVHTFLPLVHWLPRSTHRTLLKAIGLEFWSKVENLHLLSKEDLIELFESPDDVRVEQHRILGWTSNLMAWGTTSRPQDTELRLASDQEQRERQ